VERARVYVKSFGFGPMSSGAGPNRCRFNWALANVEPSRPGPMSSRMGPGLMLSHLGLGLMLSRLGPCLMLSRLGPGLMLIHSSETGSMSS